MIKLGKIYENLLLEGENEEQAKKILEKSEDIEDDKVDRAVEKLKDADPSEQNKYISTLARFVQLGVNALTGERPRTIAKGLEAAEEQYGAKLQYSKDKGFFFNKDIEDYEIEGGEGWDSNHGLAMILGNIGEHREKLKKLKNAKKTGGEDQGTPKVDGKSVSRVFKGDGIEIFSGVGQKACIEHSKGTSWCIGNPHTGNYMEQRAEGSTFYFIYHHDMDEDIPGSRVVLEVKTGEENEFEEAEIEQMKAHDKRNAEDGKVAMDKNEDGEYEYYETYDYLDLLESEYGVDTNEIFKPVPPQGEEKIQAMVKNQDIEDIVGQTHELNDGTVIDLTLAYIKENGLSGRDFKEIEEHPVTKKFLDNYIWTAITQNKLEPGATDAIPSKYFDKYLKKIYKDYNNDASKTVEYFIENKVGFYLDQVSDGVINKLMEQHLESGKKNTIPESLIPKVSSELKQKNALKFVEAGHVPVVGALKHLEEDEIKNVLLKAVKQFENMDKRAQMLYEDLIAITYEVFDRGILSDGVVKEVYKSIQSSAEKLGLDLDREFRKYNINNAEPA